MSITPIRKPVVVGIDDRPPSRIALDWAIDEATHRGLPLHIVHTRHLPPGSRLDLPEPRGDDRTPGDVAEALSRARALAPKLEVTAASPTLRPSVALVDASQRAACVVVGARGRGSVTGALLGTTSLDVAGRAASPVVVVRELPEATETPPRVVVGADGSQISAEAIGFAFAEASEREVPLTVVHVRASDFIGTYLTPQRPESDLKTIAEQEQALAAEEIAGWATKYPDVRVHRHVLRGHPVEALVDHSQGSELLVVGSRGLGGIAGMLLGSVSQGVLQHAHCPVAVVRPTAPTAG